MEIFNAIEPTGGIYVNSFKDKLKDPVSKLVNFVTFCLNQNHYHFILKPLVDDGIQKFMHRLSLGYTMYFNEKYERSGSLFQGKYKATYIETNEQLLHVSVYTNLNDRVHSDLNKKWLLGLSFSSFEEYQRGISNENFCDISPILEQFESSKEYCRYAESVLKDIVARKEQQKALRKRLID